MGDIHYIGQRKVIKYTINEKNLYNVTTTNDRF